MRTIIDVTPGDAYKSRSQIARVCSENWAEENLYCGACSSDSLLRMPNNERAVDFRCGTCEGAYQLKSGAKLGNRIVDAAYGTMIAAIRSDRVPNLVYLHYSREWHVQNVVLIPSFFFAESAIHARSPLSPTAKRAGWVGCEIMLDRIAPEGKLWMVQGGIVREKAAVRRSYEAVRPLANLSANLRGWALDVFTVVRKLGTEEFTLDQVYGYEEFLGVLHPENNNLRAKIRQQLQVLRDAGLLTFGAPGQYSLTKIG